MSERSMILYAIGAVLTLILWVFFGNPVWFATITLAFLLYGFHCAMIGTDVGDERPLIERAKAYRCSICGKSFWTGDGIAKHNRSVHPVETKMRASAAKQRLENRKKGTPMPTRWYDCPRCKGKKGNYMCPRCEGMGRTLYPFQD